MFGSMPWCSSPGYKLFRVNALLYSSLNLIDEFSSLFLRMHLLQVRLGKLSHRSMPLWTSVFFRHWASNSQDSPKGYFQLKELHTTTKLLLKWILIERWRRPSMLSSLCQHVARLQFDSCAQKHSLCGTVMMAWIWHFWINAMVFVPAAKAAPKAGAKELSYNSLNLACSGQHPCFGPNWFIQFCHTWRWIRCSPMETGKFRHWKPDSPMANQPKGYFQMKELDRTTKAIARMNADCKVEKAQYAEFNVPRCGKIAVWQ